MMVCHFTITNASVVMSLRRSIVSLIAKLIYAPVMSWQSKLYPEKPPLYMVLSLVTLSTFRMMVSISPDGDIFARLAYVRDVTRLACWIRERKNAS